MAELALLRFSLGVAWNLFAKSAAGRLQCGSIADERLRQILLNEFQKLHEHLNALRRKELVAAVAFMENGYELLKSCLEEARKEFNKARDAAQTALGVVPDISDRVLATKILVTAAIHEFPEQPEVAKTLCLKYLNRLNTLPEIVKECKSMLGSKFADKFLMGSKKTEEEILGNVSNINRCVWQFIKEFSGEQEMQWPIIKLEKAPVAIIHPVMDLVLSRDHSQLEFQSQDLATPVSMAVCKKKLFVSVATKFVAEGQVKNQYECNALQVLDLETLECTVVTGHNSNILCLASQGDCVFSGAYNKVILAWDAGSLQCIKTVSTEDHGGSIRSLSANSNSLFSACSGAKIIVWDLQSLEKQHTLREESPISSIKVTETHLFSAALTKGIKIWDLKTWSVLREFPNSDVIVSLHCRHNFLVVHGNRTIQVWNLGSMKCIRTVDHVSQCLTVIRCFLFTCSGNVVSQWDIESGKCLSNVTVLPHSTNTVLKCLHFDMNSGHLFAGGCYPNNEGYVVRW